MEWVKRGTKSLGLGKEIEMFRKEFDNLKEYLHPQTHMQHKYGPQKQRLK